MQRKQDFCTVSIRKLHSPATDVSRQDKPERSQNCFL